MPRSILSLLFGLVVGAVPSAAAHAQFVPVVSSRLWSIAGAERAAGERLFANHCGACHGREGVSKGYAPSLVGVIGRRAGSAPGFPYSDALRKSGIVWTEDNLTKWIAHAPEMVPGTPMPHVAVTDPVERLYVFEYLKAVSRGEAND